MAYCQSCGALISGRHSFCANCGAKQTSEDVSSQFMGRGVRFIFAVSPKLTEDEFALAKMVISGPSPFEGNFASVDVTDYGHFVEAPEDNWSYVKVYCQGAKFGVTMDQAEDIQQRKA